MKPRIFLVTSAAWFVEQFLIPQIRVAANEFDVSIYVDSSDPEMLKRLNINVAVIPTPIARAIRPLSDLRGVVRLYIAMLRNKPDLVHSTGPKGGLLGMIAAWLARVPVRVHTFTGQVWTNSTGFPRMALKLADRCTAWLATDILVDSLSQEDYIVKESIVPKWKTSVLGKGSISGVNAERFAPNFKVREEMRKSLGIPNDEFLILFMARITRDKGALVMAEGFRLLNFDSKGAAHLLVVGPDEENLAPAMREICKDYLCKFHLHGYTRLPENFMAASDVLCLPSYREGFGTVLINAASSGIPAIASRIYGSKDAVVDGETGLLIEPGNAFDLACKLKLLMNNPDLRSRLGYRGRERVIRDFSEDILTKALIDFYRNRLLRANK
jgi:glycosyltransferase involved in cell wall biosynthesis